MNATMRIGTSLDSLTGIVSAELEQTSDAAAESTQVGWDYEAQFTDGSSKFSSLTAESPSREEIRSTRVDEFRTAIINGRYTPNPQAIADAMSDELFWKGRSGRLRVI